MTINVSQRAFEEMTATIHELETLTSKPGTLTKKEEMRHSTLLAKLSLLKQGVSVSEFRNFETDQLLKEAGLSRMPEQPRTRMAEDVQQEYRDFLSGKPIRTANVPKDSEQRYNQVNPLGGNPQSLSYTEGQQGGKFVPTDFWSRFSTIMKQADDIFQPWASNYLETETGSTCPCPQVDDTAAASTIVGETVQSTEADIQNFAQIQLSAYTFRSGMVLLSRELIQDSAFPLGPVVDNLMALRHQRGVGKYLAVGTGISQPTGLITGVVAAGVSPTIASGSGVNDGGSETGANSIGTQDLNQCYFSVNPMYRRNGVWYMNDATLKSLVNLVDKAGRPIVSLVTGVDFVTDQIKDYHFLMGKRVAICPNMPNIASAANPIVFGDPNYFIFRSVPSSAYLQIFQEAGGSPSTFDVILRDLVGLQSFFRADSNVLISNSQQSPFGFIQSHS